MGTASNAKTAEGKAESAASESSDGQRILRVLIVDDSRTMRNITRKCLTESFRVVVTEVENGREALEALNEDEFDLILTDVDMPEMDGLELCRHLKADKKTSSIPTVILSVFNSDTDIESGFQAGADAYLPKPFRGPALKSTIEQVMNVERAEPGRHTIMIVDDSATVRAIVEEGLEEAGYEVMSATDGETALNAIRKRRPDLIITDFNMPGMNGLAFSQALHSEPQFATIPLLVMSANSDEKLMRQMLGMGAVGYLTKPFSVPNLTVMVEKYLSDHYLQLLQQKERLEYERKMMLASIMSLAKALDARDPYTNRHSESVADVAVAVGRLMGRSEAEMEMFRLAGQLHDIGKIGIRDDVLLKPGKLTDEEYGIIKQHPLIGAEILQHIPTLADVISVVRQHHERVDGKGYPDGVGGGEIGELARILAIADVYHALVSARPYRDAMPEKKAISILREGAGTQFCTECLDAFLELHEQGDLPEVARD